MTAIDELLLAIDNLCAPLDPSERTGIKEVREAAARVRAEQAGGEMSDKELMAVFMGIHNIERAIFGGVGRHTVVEGLRAVERVVRSRRP